MNKLTSGRFIFTVVTAMVFAWASIYDLLSSEQVVSVIMLIVAFYFNKHREEEK